MLDADLFGLLGADLARHMLERLGRRRAVLVHLLDGDVRLRRQAEILGLRIDDHQHRIRTVAPDQLIDGDVVLVQLRTGVIPADDALAGVHLLEHAVHVVQVVVIEEPHRLVLVVLVEGHCVNAKVS